MKKIKINKIFSSAMCVFSVLIAVACITVSASSYTSTLYIGNGSTVTGSTRYYTAGEHKISISIDKWTNYGNIGYSKLLIRLVQDNGTSSTSLSTATKKITTANVSIMSWMGTHSASDKYYVFSTRVDGTTYGGITSNNVTMQS